jgi:predicted dehydrogenase
MTTEIVRWGILGTGNIARKFASGLLALPERCRLVAVGSRTRAAAEGFVRAHAPAARAHPSYQALLDDPEVEVVYISLLNHLHAEWAVRAARAGKHVLCEKPATMTAHELEQVLAAARAAQVFFMEGFLYRCHPRWAQLQALLAAGEIGELRLLHASFCFDGGHQPAGRLLDRAQGGGALMDVGCYALSWLRGLAGAEPLATSCQARLAATGVDESACGTLLFPGGVIASFTTSVRWPAPTSASIIGSSGRIEVSEPFRCTPGVAAMALYRGDALVRTMTVEDDGLTRYAREALEVVDHLHQLQSPAMSWDDSLGQARTLDALRHQAGVWWLDEGRERAIPR